VTRRVLSVVIPAYNEALRLPATLARVREHLEGRGIKHEILVVDDGSSDDTSGVARAAAGAVRVLRHQPNRGKGYAVRQGMLAATGALRLMTDADLSTPIDELARLEAEIDRGFDVAIGSRAVAGARIEVHQPAYREALGRLFNVLVQVLLLPGLADTQCGFKLFNGRAARAVFAVAKLNGWAFDVEILHLCVRFGCPVVEVPVRWGHSPGSKVRPSAYLHVLTEIAQLRLAHRRTRAPQLDPESPPTSARQAPEHHI
jgi:glycosyltransferase involved in cell wall biosynthesis